MVCFRSFIWSQHFYVSSVIGEVNIGVVPKLQIKHIPPSQSLGHDAAVMVSQTDCSSFVALDLKQVSAFSHLSFVFLIPLTFLSPSQHYLHQYFPKNSLHSSPHHFSKPFPSRTTFFFKWSTGLAVFLTVLKRRFRLTDVPQTKLIKKHKAPQVVQMLVEEGLNQLIFLQIHIHISLMLPGKHSGLTRMARLFPHFLAKFRHSLLKLLGVHGKPSAIGPSSWQLSDEHNS